MRCPYLITVSQSKVPREWFIFTFMDGRHAACGLNGCVTQPVRFSRTFCHPRPPTRGVDLDHGQSIEFLMRVVHIHLYGRKTCYVWVKRLGAATHSFLVGRFVVLVRQQGRWILITVSQSNAWGEWFIFTFYELREGKTEVKNEWYLKASPCRFLHAFELVSRLAARFSPSRVTFREHCKLHG